MEQLLDTKLAEIKTKIMNSDNLMSISAINTVFKEFDFVILENIAAFASIRNHKTIKIKHNNQIINIDENISELIGLIWKCDIETEMSCENNIPFDYIWICFSTFSDYKKFMRIVINKEDKALSNTDILGRVMSGSRSRGYIPNAWIYDILNDNNRFRVSARFPKIDYPFVVDRFKKFIENKS